MLTFFFFFLHDFPDIEIALEVHLKVFPYNLIFQDHRSPGSLKAILKLASFFYFYFLLFIILNKIEAPSWVRLPD